MAAPIEVACPNCQAPEGKPCNVPTDSGRRSVPWFHAARENLASGVTLPTPAEILATTLLATIEDDPSVTMVACECGRDVQMSSETGVAELQSLIEHAAFDHATRYQIDVYRTAKLVSGYELGVLLRLSALTEAEEKWRRGGA